MEMQENMCHACYIYLETYDAPMHSKEKQASPLFVNTFPSYQKPLESKHALLILNMFARFLNEMC